MENTESMQQMSSDARPGNRRRKTLAIAAAGLALGVGAVSTLAAWTSTENVYGDFSSGQFGLQGSADGSNFTTNDAEPGLEVFFGDLASTLAPGDEVYAPYAVRLDPASSYSADVVLAASSGTGDAAASLTYDVYQTASFGCDGEVVAELLVDQPSSVSTASDSLFTLDAIDQPAYLCFKVTAGPDLPQASTANIAWQLLGTSTEALS